MVFDVNSSSHIGNRSDADNLQQLFHQISITSVFDFLREIGLFLVVATADNLLYELGADQRVLMLK